MPFAEGEGGYAIVVYHLGFEPMAAHMLQTFHVAHSGCPVTAV